MGSNRKPKALLDAEKRIKELEAQLASEKASKDMWYKEANENTTIIDGIHEILDDLGIRGYKDENKYQRIPLTVRLFAWAMKAHEKS